MKGEPQEVFLGAATRLPQLCGLCSFRLDTTPGFALRQPVRWSFARRGEAVPRPAPVAPGNQEPKQRFAGKGEAPPRPYSASLVDLRHVH